MEKPAIAADQAPLAVFGNNYIHATWKMSSAYTLPAIKAVVEKYKQKSGLGFNRMFGMNKEQKYLGLDMQRGIACYATTDVELMGKIGSYKEIPFDSIYSVTTDLSKPNKYKLELRTTKREYCFKFKVVGDWVEFLERLKYVYSKKDNQPLFPMTEEYLKIAISIKGTTAHREATQTPKVDSFGQEEPPAKTPPVGSNPPQNGANPVSVPPLPVKHINPIMAITKRPEADQEAENTQKFGQQTKPKGPSKDNGTLSPRDPEAKVVRVKSKDKGQTKLEVTDESQDEAEEPKKTVNEIVKQRKNI